MSYLRSRILGMKYLLVLALIGAPLLMGGLVLGMCMMIPMLAATLAIAPSVENPGDEQVRHEQNVAHWEERIATLEVERVSIEQQIASLQSAERTDAIEKVNKLPTDAAEKAERMIRNHEAGKITRLQAALSRNASQLEFAENMLAGIEKPLEKSETKTPARSKGEYGR